MMAAKRTKRTLPEMPEMSLRIVLPESAAVPALCRKLYAKRIQPNGVVRNLFPHHGPGPGRRGYEDWYAVSLREGAASLLLTPGSPAVARSLRVFVRNGEGDALGCVTQASGETAVLTHLTVPEPGVYYVIVQTDALYMDATAGEDRDTANPARYVLRVTQAH